MFGFPMSLGDGLPIIMADGYFIHPLDGAGFLLREELFTGGLDM